MNKIILFLLLFPVSVLGMSDDYERQSAISFSGSSLIRITKSFTGITRKKIIVKPTSANTSQVLVSSPFRMFISRSEHQGTTMNMQVAGGTVGSFRCDFRYVQSGVNSIGADLTNKKLICNNVSHNAAFTMNSVNVPGFYINTANSDGTVNSPVTGNYYEIKMWDANGIASHLVAARRKSDNVCGMYDMKDDAFYTATGTATCVPFTTDPWKI